MDGTKASPIFGFEVKSAWDRLGEIPGLSTITSAVRIVKGSLCGLWDVVCLMRRGEAGLAAVKQDLWDIGVGIAEIVPLVNVFAARYFNRSEMLENLKDLPSNRLQAMIRYLETGVIVTPSTSSASAPLSSTSEWTQELSWYQQRMLDVYNEALLNKNYESLRDGRI